MVEKHESESAWCLVANIVEKRQIGNDGGDVKHGTKHFPPGTKIYCMPAQWGDGYAQIKVIGRHRGSKQYVTMVIKSEWVTNWRAKVVYSPEVLFRLREDSRAQWQSQQQVEEYVIMMQIREKMHETHSEEEIREAIHKTLDEYRQK